MNEKEKNNLIKKIAKRYSLRLLLLFGSRVDNKNLHRESDFDVAYLSEKKLTLRQETEMMTKLAPVFGSDNIDLVNLKNASPLLYYAVFNHCRVLYQEHELLFPKLRLYALRKFVEAEPLYKLKAQRLKEYVKTL